MGSAFATWARKSVGAMLAASIPPPALNIRLRREIIPVLSLLVIDCNSVQIFVSISIISTITSARLLYFFFTSSWAKI